MKNIILMGPPGSGKNTQIDALIEYLDGIVISSGDITRSLARKNPKIAEILRSGALVSDEVIIGEIDQTLEKIDKTKSLIFDGFPRTLTQAEKLNELLINHDKTLDAVIYLNVREEEVVKRLSTRLVCSECGGVIPEGAEVCPKCGGKVTKREDDEPATIINRMQAFLDKTMPLVSYYRNKGILIEINGEQSVEAVTKTILDRLDLCEKKN